MMIKVLIKMCTVSLLLALTLGFSNGANAAATSTMPPLCSGGGPGLGQAWVYTGLNYGGTCYLLSMDGSGDLWTSWDVSTGFPNDQMQSVWVGPDVTLVLFWNSLGTSDNGVPLNFGPGQYSANLGGWNRQASAARVQYFPFGSCGNTQGLLSLFTNQNFNQGAAPNDCTELAPRNYPNPVSMGFRNDTVSSFLNLTATPFVFWANSSFFGCLINSIDCGTAYYIAWHSSGANLGSFNDSLSSLTIAPVH